MLKVFVPQYDGPTRDNARLANDVFPNSPRHLFVGAAATRAALQSEILSAGTTALLLLAHGDHECVYGQAEDRALTIDDIDANEGDVLRLPIFAWACKTSVRIGPKFHAKARKPGAWWGYRTTVSAPSPRRISAFRDVLNYIVSKFPGVQTLSAAKDFFAGLRDLCERHRGDVVYIMATSNDLRDAHEIAVALRETWEHLDALLPSVPQPVDAGVLVESILEGV